MLQKPTTRSARRYSDGSHLQQSGKRSVAKLIAKAVVMKRTDEGNKRLGNVSQSEEAECRPVIHSSFGDCLLAKLHPGHDHP